VIYTDIIIIATGIPIRFLLPYSDMLEAKTYSHAGYVQLELL